MNEPPNPEVAVFAAALELPADQRGAYLDQACAGDAALRRQVEALLRDHDDAGNFFDKLASVAQPASADEATPGSSAAKRLPGIPSEKPGDRIGRYKLLQQIGEGGCGAVYMAEQEERVRRRVALKVIKLGMDTKSVIARFEAERQALALMDHANIAKVLDAGATENGRPYFVMELVRGIKITDYCDQNNLSTQQRLELFTQICRAIQHAHQKGIIHRDIKPSNILVADHDGRPVPKIIDFGIAKATTDQRLTDKTLFTAFEQFIGTPAYMSPEQAKLSGLDIDTRSDIYSLGVLLYELLTARTPFESNRLLEVGLDEIRRIIREEEPVRPSTRLQTLDAAEQTTVARHRQSEPPKLAHLIRGDLDRIVMKSLEKDRTRRYQTANGLAMDIERHLKSEPVIARPPTSLYRLQRMVRRHKGAFAAATAIFAALIAGLGVSTWLFVRARTAQRETEAALVGERHAVAETEAALAREALLRQQSESREKLTQAQILYNAGKYAEAESLLNQIPSGLVQQNPAHADLRRGLGYWDALHEQWKEAAANFAVLMQVDPLDDWNAWSLDFQSSVPALIQGGDMEGYEKLRQAAISRYLNTTNSHIANRICQVCLLRPADEKTMARLAPMHDVLVRAEDETQMTESPNVYDWLALATLEYRRGDYPKAIEWCQRCLKVPMVTGSTVKVQAILAMAHHQGCETKFFF